MKPKATLRHFLAAIGCATIAVSSASAATFYLDSNGNTAGFGSTDVTWSTPANMWSTNILGTSNIGGSTFISSLDDFNIGTAANSYSGTVTLSNSTQSIRSLTSAGSSVVTLKSGGTVRTLNLGSGGLTMNGTSAVTMGDSVATNNLLIGLGAFGQTWTNNTANNLTILNTAATFSRSAGGTLTFNKVGAGEFSMSTTVLNNDTTGIVGPWALFGTGTSTRYAVNNAGTIAGYSGGTAAAGAENFTSSTTNYDYDGSGANTLTANRVANTVRYTGTGNVIDLGAAGTNTLTANGILAAGASGTLTIQRTGGTGTLRAGSTGTNSELIIAGPQNINITAPISNGSGASALTYSGTGTLTLSGDNTYTGANTVNSGTLALGSATALGTTGKALGVYGSGTLDLNGFNANVGAFNGDSGSAIVTNSAAGDVKELTVGTGNTAGSFAGVISGNLRLIKTGTQTLTLSGVNTFTGGLILDGGKVIPGIAGDDSTLGPAGSTITVTAYTTIDGGGVTTYDQNFEVVSPAILSFTNGNGSATLSQPLTGTGGISPSRDGRTTTLASTANTFTGPIVFDERNAVIAVNSLADALAPGGGAISLTDNSSAVFRYGSGAIAPLVLNNRQFVIESTNTGNTAFSIYNDNTASSNANTITVNTALSVAGTGTKNLVLRGANTGNNTFGGAIADGSGIVALTKADAGKWILGGANTYTSATTISAGNLEIGGSGTLGNVSAGVGSYAGNISIANTSSGRLTYNSSASQTLSGVVSGAGALFVESGTLTLTNTNGYTGATNVNGGTLLINGSTSSTSVVTVNGGAVGGTGSVGSSLSLLSGSFNVVNLLDALQVVGTVSIYAGFGVDNLTGLDWGTVSAGTYTLIDGTLGSGVFAGLDHKSLGTAYDAGFGRTAYFQEGSLQLVVNVIPEPSAALLGGLGALLLLRRRRA